MTARTLEVRLEQFEEPAGFLKSTDAGEVSFSYSANFQNNPNAIPISLALPLGGRAFNDVETRAFFDNLLPENNQLQQVMEREGLSRTDIVGLLYHLGEDCPGAISCLPEGAPPAKIPGSILTDYDILDNADFSEIVRRLADREPLPNELRDPSPVAGVQRKIAIAFLDGQFGVPKKGLRVPTTHILKVPRRGKGREARLETAAANLANAVGLETAIPVVLNVAGIEALLITRFDRTISEHGSVHRIHQEDFAQALGLPASLKYERYGQGPRRFSSAAIVKLLDMTDEPAVSRMRFIRATLFNLAIGNTDNHAKNHALIYDKGSVPRFAPLYDLLPTRLDKDVNHSLSFNIGKAEHPDSLTQEDVTRFFTTFGFTKVAASRFAQSDALPLLTKLDAEARSLTADGLKDFDDLIGRETTRLASALSLQVTLRQRDEFLPSAGGWKMGS